MGRVAGRLLASLTAHPYAKTGTAVSEACHPRMRGIVADDIVYPANHLRPLTDDNVIVMRLAHSSKPAPFASSVRFSYQPQVTVNP